jgi:hypothetical protein
MGVRSPRAGRRAPNEALHCSFGDRASTDPVTNSTYLPVVELGDNLDWFFLPGGMPVSWLSSFLHEAVHHWSFQTVVGSALAGLQLRARMRILESAMGENERADQDAIEDIVRFDHALALLRPIAEGLSLFAEFDVMPMYHTPVISRPMTWAYHAFTDPDREELKEYFGRSLNILLQEMRFNDHFIRRKTNVLLQPLSVSSGSYLVGYLTIKALWQHALHKAKPFGDADLFYTFIKRYFYSDFGLVEKLLQTRTVGEAAGKELLHYFGERLKRLFFKFDWKTECDRLIQSLQEPDTDDATVLFPPIHTDPAAQAEGERLLGELLKYFEDSPPASRIGGVRSMHYMTLIQRHLMRVASFPVHIKPAAAGKIAIKSGNRTLFEAQPVNDWKPARAKGSLDLYISISNVYRVATVSVGDKVVAIKFQGTISQAWRDQFQEYLADRDRADGFQEAFQGGLDAFINVSGFRPRFEELHAGFEKVIDALYFPAALNWVRDEDMESCRDKMKDRGVLAIVDGNVNLLKSLAGLGLCASFLFTENEAPQLLPQMEIPIHQAMDALEKCADRHGMPLIFGRGNKPLNSYV